MTMSRLSKRFTLTVAVCSLLAAMLVGAPTTASAVDPDPIGTVTRFTDDVGAPRGITAGSDGNMWFADGHGAIQRMTPAGELTAFELPVDVEPMHIAEGSDGNFWFTTLEGSIGRMTPTGIVDLFPAVTPGSPPGPIALFEIVAGPDGNVWFTSPLTGQIGRITPSGVIDLFANPDVEVAAGITVGPDGQLWFTYASNYDPDFGNLTDPGIGHISTGGDFTLLDAEDLQAAGLQTPLAVTLGPDGNLWVTDAEAIDRITPGGQLTAFPVDGSPPSWDIATGPDGNLWFTQFSSNRVGRMTPAGSLTYFPPVGDPSPRADLWSGVAAGPDGTVWFTAYGRDGANVTRGAVSRVVSGSLPTCSAAPFVDVPVDHAFCGQIQWTADEGITMGYPDGTFGPVDLMTRQAAAAFLYRLAGSPDGADPACSAAPFSDVPVDHPFCGEIAWASAEGIAQGYPGGTFGPYEGVSRQAAAAMFYRFAGEPNGVDPSCTAAPFSDVATSDLFCGEISWAAQAGIVNGYPDGTFGPVTSVSRQSMAAFLYRLDNTAS